MGVWCSVRGKVSNRQDKHISIKKLIDTLLDGKDYCLTVQLDNKQNGFFVDQIFLNIEVENAKGFALCELLCRTLEDEASWVDLECTVRWVKRK